MNRIQSESVCSIPHIKCDTRFVSLHKDKHSTNRTAYVVIGYWMQSCISTRHAVALKVLPPSRPAMSVVDIQNIQEKCRESYKKRDLLIVRKYFINEAGLAAFQNIYRNGGNAVRIQTVLFSLFAQNGCPVVAGFGEAILLMLKDGI